MLQTEQHPEGGTSTSDVSDALLVRCCDGWWLCWRIIFHFSPGAAAVVVAAVAVLVFEAWATSFLFQGTLEPIIQ